MRKITEERAKELIIKGVLGFNVKDKSILICSNELHPLQSNIFKVRVKPEKL